MDCEAGITSVTWDSARGATGYTVHAEGSGGHNATCTSSDTNCAFLDLVCGQDYTMVVLANHDSCVSLASESITTTTCKYASTPVTMKNDLDLSDQPTKNLITDSYEASFTVIH